MTQPMTQQQPFESGGPFMTQDFSTKEPPQHTRMTRFEKVEFLEETTPFTRHNMFNELLGWMNEEEFAEFYETFCSKRNICRSYEEINEKYGE